MTVAIPEVAGAAARRAGQKKIERRAGQKVVRGRVERSAYDTYNTRTRTRQAAPSATPTRKRPSPAVQQAAATAAGSYAGQARQAGQAGYRAHLVPGDRQYQGIILAEFLVAALLISVTPLATGGSPAAKAKGGPSPYDTEDLKQLVAVGAVYFILALVSSGRHGRFAAWFGGLILLAIGMSKAGQSQLTAVFKAASGGESLGSGGTPE